MMIPATTRAAIASPRDSRKMRARARRGRRTTPRSRSRSATSSRTAPRCARRAAVRRATDRTGRVHDKHEQHQRNADPDRVRARRTSPLKRPIATTAIHPPRHRRAGSSRRARRGSGPCRGVLVDTVCGSLGDRHRVQREQRGERVGSGVHGLRDDTETAGREADGELDDDEEDRRGKRDKGCATARRHEPMVVGRGRAPEPRKAARRASR